MPCDVGRFPRDVGRFPRDVGRFPRDVGRFLTAPRWLLADPVMWGGLPRDVGRFPRDVGRFLTAPRWLLADPVMWGPFLPPHCAFPLFYQLMKTRNPSRREPFFATPPISRMQTARSVHGPAFLICWSCITAQRAVPRAFIRYEFAIRRVGSPLARHSCRRTAARPGCHPSSDALASGPR